MAAGNGAAMRIAPLAFFLDPNTMGDRRLLRDVCRITHKNDEAFVGALAVVVAIRTVISGTWDWVGSLLDHVATTLPDSSVRDRCFELAKLPPDASLVDVGQQFGCTGYVVESVPYALYGVQRIATNGFGSVLEQIISAGGDTDTNASIAGQVAGAWLGIGGIPMALIQRLSDSQSVLETARQIATMVPADT